jgi:amidase
MSSGDLWRWDAVDLAAAIRLRKVSSREAVDSVLARLAAVNPRINAVSLALAEAARAAADAADAAAKRGDALGPLHGVPVTIKENIDQQGLATVNGVAAFKGVIAPADSPVAANFRRAGAICVGRTSTPAFSLRYFTDNGVIGRTHNPWSRAHTPGGSSGGAASAVAAGIGPIAHGNDYGGSIRYPAYCCGVAGLRPSFGRVPAYNPSAAAERPPTAQLMSVQGPLARRVRDLRLALAVMALGDARDPWWVPAPLVGKAPKRPIKVALAPAPAGLSVDPAVREAVVKAGRALAEAGYAVEEAALPPVADVGERAFGAISFDVEHFMLASIREHADADGRRAIELYLEGGPRVAPADYAATLADRARLVRDWSLFLERYPVVVLPVSARPPMPHGADLVGPAETRAMIRDQSPLVAFNFVGLPGVGVPVGTATAAEAPRGLPLGVQVVAARFREDLALDAAEVIEARHGLATPIDPV